jgi:NitT/TauT family transport system ATP-binding protein
MSWRGPPLVALAGGNARVPEKAKASQIEIDSVSKVYPANDGGIAALRDVSINVDRGEFLSVLGPSGCGKSTLMLLTSGLEQASSGRIEIEGKIIDRPFTDVGIVFQDHALYDWRTVLDNVMLQAEIRRLPKQEIREKARKLLLRTGLAQFEKKYPHELSGGMRQRAAICRALVHEPPFLFFDEPFGALDALTREQMRIDLEKLWLDRRPTVLFITHSISEAVALSDRIIVMTLRHGRVDQVIDVGLPRPRDKAVIASKAFSDHCDAITERFMEQGVIQY